MSEYWDRDIVERLRGRAEYAKQEKTGTADGDAVHLNQAADEIGRLRAQIEILRVDVQKWTDAYQLTAALVEQSLTALVNVNKIVSEAAMTGFNCKDGDWPERLFESQRLTSAAIKSAKSCSVSSTDRQEGAA